jgi:hypothetical protein
VVAQRPLRWSVARYFTIRVGSPWQLATPFPQAHKVQFLPSTTPRILHGLLRHCDCIRDGYLSHWAPTVASEFDIHASRGKYDRRSNPIFQNGNDDPRDSAGHALKCDSAYRRTTAVTRTKPTPPPIIHPHHPRNMTIRPAADLRDCK